MLGKNQNISKINENGNCQNHQKNIPMLHGHCKPNIKFLSQNTNMKVVVWTLLIDIDTQK